MLLHKSNWGQIQWCRTIGDAEDKLLVWKYKLIVLYHSITWAGPSLSACVRVYPFLCLFACLRAVHTCMWLCVCVCVHAWSIRKSDQNQKYATPLVTSCSSMAMRTNRGLNSTERKKGEEYGDIDHINLYVYTQKKHILDKDGYTFCKYCTWKDICQGHKIN